MLSRFVSLLLGMQQTFVILSYIIATLPTVFIVFNEFCVDVSDIFLI